MNGCRSLRVAVLAIVVVASPVPGAAAAPDGNAAGRPASPPAVGRLADVGVTRTLEVLPLVDWNVANPALRGEAGVAYLVRTDRNTILFDVGGNLAESDPSPLVANLRALGIDLAGIDTVVISHAHGDHVGGPRHFQERTFSLDAKPVDLSGKRVFVPVPIAHPGTQPVVTHGPTAIAPGVATTGALRGELHLGPVDEQALVVRVEGKGVAVIVGCGHQGLGPLLERVAQLFDEPLYAVIGGLHYPIPRGRWIRNGVDVQRFVAWGHRAGPTVADVRRDIEFLAAKQPQWVSLSPHDSSDEMIAEFRSSFGPRYHDLVVGETQAIAKRIP